MTDNSADVQAIRSLLDNRVDAIHAKDLERLLAPIAPDVRSFDLLDPLQSTGSDAVRQRAERWFTGYESAIGYTIQDVQIVTAHTLAIAHYLYHVSGTLKTGDSVSMWVRATTCFERQNGDWVIIHEHQSVPFDPTSGMASLDLEPE